VKNKYLKHFTGRLVITAFFALLQIITFILMIFALSSYAIPIYFVLTAISVIVVISIINRDRNPAYKLLWSITILTFPVFGGLMYLAASLQSSTFRFKKKHQTASDIIKPHIVKTTAVSNADKPSMAAGANYLSGRMSFPLYKNTSAVYLNITQNTLRVKP